ncbi:MAG TPA: alkaline phosphatase family protein [Thermoanaerobaculia bacterium]|nr:alkaline phosphatase family protein [Thermoanaerobaculia bacterium]
MAQPPPSDQPTPYAARFLTALAAAFVPGFLAGTQIAGLLFFLNPGLPFSPLPLIRAILIYGTLVASATTLILLPWSLRRPRSVQRLLPWALSAVLAGAAILDWYHASHFAFYLPPGINVRLIKAALWLTLAALICFYTALLHALHGRRYGRRSWIGLALVALLSVYVMVERREAFQPRPAASPRPTALEVERRPRLWVVGIDGATLDAILPLAEQGRLPFFSHLLRSGASARLTTLSPVRDPALWTTLATGKLPYKHKILGWRQFPAPFLSPGAMMRLLPTGVGFSRWGTFGVRPQPIDARNRSGLAAWEVLARLGISTGLLGWPVSWPPPSNLTFAFADRFFSDQPAASTALPSELAERGKLFRVVPSTLDPEVRGRFGDHPPPLLVNDFAADRWRQSLTLFLTGQQPMPDGLFLMLPGLASVSRHFFGGFSAVQFEGASDPADRQAALWVSAYYQELDRFLSQLWRQEPPPRLLAIVSAYGMDPPGRWDQLWRKLTRSPALGGRISSAPDGIFLLAGEGVRAGTIPGGVRLIDVLPTLIYGLGYPVARDLDGRVMTSAFTTGFLSQHPLSFVPSYETMAPEETGPEP